MLCRLPRIFKNVTNFGSFQQATFISTGKAVSQEHAEDTLKNVENASSVSKVMSPTLLAKEFTPLYQASRQVWIENLNTVEEEKRGIIELHPDVFACLPRLDIIHNNIRWQQLYKNVKFEHAKTRAEKRGGGRKPFPQKGLGRSRHGSLRSPLFKGGGAVHGPRSPTSHFYMLPFFQRILGLTSTLSVKLAQDDLHIVDSLDIPTDEPEYLEQLVAERNWGLSVLFIDDTDFMPRNITAATDSIKHMNLMPSYGLNVYSMLKHETLVLTTEAAKQIEERLLFHLNRCDSYKVSSKFRISQH